MDSCLLEKETRVFVTEEKAQTIASHLNQEMFFFNSNLTFDETVATTSLPRVLATRSATAMDTLLDTADGSKDKFAINPTKTD